MTTTILTALALALAHVPAGSGPANAPVDDVAKQARARFEPIPAKPPQLKDNPATPAKVQLGKLLYFEPRLSASQLISCNSCHNVGLGGGDLQETSVGHGWQKGPRNAPTVLNAVFNVAQFWDGRADDLKAQAKGPLQESVEMASDPARVTRMLKSIPGYEPLFRSAFPGEPDPITFENVAKAIEVFEATLLTPDAPFDAYLRGNAKALSPSEEAGLALFLSKGCANCHDGVNVGGDGYFPFGVVAAPAQEVRPPGDTGRFKVTNTGSDKYVFRSPSLRNVAVTQPYFHSGKVWKLTEAVKIMASSQLGITATDDEVAKLTAFLRTLTGQPPRMEYPLLPPSSERTPPPELKVKVKATG